MAPNIETPATAFSDFAGMSRHGMDEFVKAQSALLERFQDANRRWLDRWQAETQLISDFSAKLTAARSLPEAATAYQEMATRQLEMVNEDAKRIIADSVAQSEALTKALSSGWAARPGMSS